MPKTIQPEITGLVVEGPPLHPRRGRELSDTRVFPVLMDQRRVNWPNQGAMVELVHQVLDEGLDYSDPEAVTAAIERVRAKPHLPGL